MLGASLMFALMGYFVKLLSAHMSSLEIVFFRNVFGVGLILFSLWRVRPEFVGGKPFLLFFRGFIGFSALLLFFYNIAKMPLADAMTFSKTSPIFTALLAWWLLKERLKSKAWLAIFAGFVGMALIVKPTGEFDLKLALTGLLSGFGAAMAYTSIRELKKFYEPRLIVLSFVTIGTVGPLVLMGVGEVVETETFDFMIARFVMPEGVQWLWLAVMGVLATFSQLFMTKAYAATKAGVAGAASYANILFALLIGLAIGEGWPDLYGSLGILLIVAGGLAVSRMKH